MQSFLEKWDCGLRLFRLAQGDREAFNRFFHAILSEGVYLAPSAFEAGFVSAAHTETDIEQTVNAASRVFARRTAYPAQWILQ